MRSKRNSKTFILLFLGLLSAFGPFVMDMYLPTLPAMSVYFRTTSSMVQLGLTTSMAGLAAGQLFFGPLSDKYGRRPVLSVALMLFLLSTAGCIFSENILQFITLRFLQGVSGAGGVVLSRSIAADKYSARELAGVLAVIGGINGVATVAAPIAGGFLADASGWQGIFYWERFYWPAVSVWRNRIRPDSVLPSGGTTSSVTSASYYATGNIWPTLYNTDLRWEYFS